MPSSRPISLVNSARQSFLPANHVGILEAHPVSSAGVQLREATLATHYMPSHLLPELESELQQLGTEASSRKAVHELLAKFEVGSLCCARHRLAVT